MVRPSQAGQARRAGRRHAVLAWGAFSLAGCLVLGGCASTRNQGDPLLGEHKGNPNITPIAPAKTSSVVQPPGLTPSLNSPAALAVNTQPGSRPLAIKEATWQRNAQSSPQGAALPAGPVVQPVPREGQANMQLTGWEPIGPRTDSPDALIQSRNLINPQQETVPGGVHFWGFVRDRANPNRLHFVEATAPDYLTAVQAVVQQVDQLR